MYFKKFLSEKRQELNNPKDRHIAVLALATMFAVGAMLIFGREDAMGDTAMEPTPENALEFSLQASNESDWSVFPAIEGHSLGQVEILRRAYFRCKEDPKPFKKGRTAEDYIIMLKGENGTVDPNRKSDVPGEPSYGLCQIHQGYHPEIVDDPRFFTDIDWQLDQCCRLWKGGTNFYGIANKWKVSHFFDFGKGK